jgi:hypothetical protein
MNATNNYLFKYITLYNSILFESQGVTVPRVGDEHRHRARISDWWAAVGILNVARVRFVTGPHCFEPNPLTNGFYISQNEHNILEKPPLCPPKFNILCMWIEYKIRNNFPFGITFTFEI